MANSFPLLRVTDLRKSFGTLEVLKGVSFDVAAGERIAIIGPSGSGKSTCLRGINFLEPPTSGRVELDGEVIGEREVQPGRWRRMSDKELAPQRAEIGMVFQLFYLWPHLSARDNVALQPQKIGGLSRKAALELADSMLAKVHMTHKADEFPERLSGGQQQRVAIARALVNRPAILLADEPTGNLDSRTSVEIIDVLQKLNEKGLTIVLVTHESDIARFARRMIEFRDGRIRHDDPVSDRPVASEILKSMPKVED